MIERDYTDHAAERVYDILTGPIGSGLRVVPISAADGVHGYEGVLENRVVVDGQLDSIVLAVRPMRDRRPGVPTRPARQVIRWAAIESVLILTTPFKEADQ